LGQFAKEATQVSQEVGMEGKLGGQALVLDVEGTWRELTGVVANLTSQVQFFLIPKSQLGLTFPCLGMIHSKSC
jgi:hypothetical protein